MPPAPMPICCPNFFPLPVPVFLTVSTGGVRNWLGGGGGGGSMWGGNLFAATRGSHRQNFGWRALPRKLRSRGRSGNFLPFSYGRPVLFQLLWLHNKKNKDKLQSSSFFRFDLAYFWNKPSSLSFDLSNLCNKKTSLRFDLSYLWNKQTWLRFDLSNLWNKQSSLRFDLSNL
jgi:hypothetical protein